MYWGLGFALASIEQQRARDNISKARHKAQQQRDEQHFNSFCERDWRSNTRRSNTRENVRGH